MPDKANKFGLLPSWLSNYEKSWLRFDVIAGSVAAAVVIPKAMAYATIAGLPVQVGLYTVLIPMVIYALSGTSRALSVSTTTTIAVLTATELEDLNTIHNPNLLITALVTLTCLVGIILLLSAVMRLGFIANFISEPVLIGFKAGIGMVIILDQISKLLGIHFSKGSFIHNLSSIIQLLPESSIPTLALGVIMIILLMGLEHFFPKVPAPLIAVALGITIMKVLHLQSFGIEQVGYIPKGLPSIVWPDVSLVSQLWGGALGIALMSFTETIAAGRAFSKGDEPPIKANRELLATGLANTGSAIFGAMPSGGGTSQTAINRIAGSKTQVSALVTAGIALLTMLFIAPLLGSMPQATLAAVVIVYSIGLIKTRDFREILKIRRTEFIWALVALIGVVLFGTLKGIVVAIIVSLIALAQQVADPPLRVLGRKPGSNVFRPLSVEHPEDETYPGLLILRPEGRIFFLNASRVGEKINALLSKYKPRVIAIDFSGVFDLEYTALKMLIEAEKRLSNAGISVWLVGLNPTVLEMVNRSSLSETLGLSRMHFSLELAVKKFNEEKGN
ncbi:SulP family inorganic anion transporter [Solitalea lacus]|uniref:SulP family inorganic anion transporter n=1 Tax=Solitalea lacus TaxID=2911172 RepID=UPI001EDB2800|nr:SulP family inorganic anion transporter [Solitalea lacus]UKJ08606.1 SulP family inorganic anion transporter [Solitalea lacus]